MDVILKRKHTQGKPSPLRVKGGLERAQDLLSQHFRVHVVAAKLGYSCSSSFSQAYRRFTGASPSAWYRANVAEPR